jgi:hypothetical protein
MPQSTTTNTLQPSTPEGDANIRTLFRVCRDVITGATTDELETSNPVVEGMELLFKNGTLLEPTTEYSVAGTTITLDVAAIAGDVFVILYHYRATR